MDRSHHSPVVGAIPGHYVGLLHFMLLYKSFSVVQMEVCHLWFHVHTISYRCSRTFFPVAIKKVQKPKNNNLYLACQVTFSAVIQTLSRNDL